MFVVTLIPSEKYGNSPQKMANFRYLGGSNFTGKVFASTLDGRFVEVSQYVNGKFVGLLKIATRKQLAENNIDITDDPFYESIVFAQSADEVKTLYRAGKPVYGVFCDLEEGYFASEPGNVYKTMTELGTNRINELKKSSVKAIKDIKINWAWFYNQKGWLTKYKVEK